MNPVSFHDVTFGYDEAPVFSGWSFSVPSGVVSLTGPNGSGKTTVLLLASGRMVPSEGKVLLLGHDTKTLGEEDRNRLASLVYQNMEFENEEPLGDLLEYVASVGHLDDKSPALIKTVSDVMELAPLLHRKTQTLAKGEMQRAVMAFSLLYGSKVVVMDEPIFALEDPQKHRVLGFLREFTQHAGVSFLFSVHELELTRKFSTSVMLFSKDKPPVIGATSEVLTRENLESAYQVPAVLLHQKERLFREMLLGAAKG